MESVQGVDNNHVLLKKADVDDTSGMLKYAVDLDPTMEKESSLINNIISKEIDTKEK